MSVKLYKNTNLNVKMIILEPLDSAYGDWRGSDVSKSYQIAQPPKKNYKIIIKKKL